MSRNGNSFFSISLVKDILLCKPFSSSNITLLFSLVLDMTKPPFNNTLYCQTYGVAMGSH